MTSLPIGSARNSDPGTAVDCLLEIRDGAKVKAKGLAQANGLSPADVIFSGISLSLSPGDRLAIFSPSRTEATALVNCLSGVDILDSGILTHNASVSWPLGSDDTFNRILSGHLNALFAAEVNSPMGCVEDNVQLIQELCGVDDDLFHQPLQTWPNTRRELLKLAVWLAFEFDVAVIGKVYQQWNHRSLNPLAIRIREVFESRIHDRAMIVLGCDQEELAIDYCNRAIIIENGSVVHEGTPMECSQKNCETLLESKIGRRLRVRNRVARRLAAINEATVQ